METPYFLNPFGVSQKQEEYDEMPIGSIVMWNNTITQSLKNFVPGTTITLREDNGLREFLVVAHDYPSANNNRTLLIRKYAHSSRAWGTSSSGNAYANNSIDTWLNNDYYMLLDSDIRHNIAEVSIPYTIGNGNTSVSTINRSIFLLSATELNFTGYNAEGSVLQIYPSLRIAQNDAGIASDQWTRSPAIANTTYAVKVTSAGAVTTALITSAAYARPAFTLPSTFQFLGNQLPNGWQLCDGTNGVPDLRGRFIVGAGNSYSVGTMGGESEVQIATANLPVHTHVSASQSMTARDFPHTHNLYVVSSGQTGTSNTRIGTASGSSTVQTDSISHGHRLQSNTLSTNLAAGVRSHNNLPPYYRLFYIIKTGGA